MRIGIQEIITLLLVYLENNNAFRNPNPRFLGYTVIDCLRYTLRATRLPLILYHSLGLDDGTGSSGAEPIR
jgi:hypothetical protein